VGSSGDPIQPLVAEILIFYLHQPGGKITTPLFCARGFLVERRDRTIVPTHNYADGGGGGDGGGNSDSDGDGDGDGDGNGDGNGDGDGDGNNNVNVNNGDNNADDNMV
jgi:hypothetical protein